MATNSKFDVSALQSYTQNSDQWLAKAFFAAKTVNYLTPYTGFKKNYSLPNYDEQVVFQPGSVSGWTPSGSTVLSARSGSVATIKIQKEYYLEDLIGTWGESLLRPGANQTSYNLEEQVFNKLTGKIGEALEMEIWKGNVLSSSMQNLHDFDGFIKLIPAASGSVNGNTANITSSLTTSNILTAVDNFCLAIPGQIQTDEDLRIYMGPDLLNIYKIALKNSGNYFYSPDTQTSGADFIIPAFNIRVSAVPGLYQSGRMFSFKDSHGAFITDLSDDFEKLHIDFDYKLDNIFAVGKFRAAVDVRLPQFATYY